MPYAESAKTGPAAVRLPHNAGFVPAGRHARRIGPHVTVCYARPSCFCAPARLDVWRAARRGLHARPRQAASAFHMAYGKHFREGDGITAPAQSTSCIAHDMLHPAGCLSVALGCTVHVGIRFWRDGLARLRCTGREGRLIRSGQPAACGGDCGMSHAIGHPRLAASPEHQARSRSATLPPLSRSAIGSALISPAGIPCASRPLFDTGGFVLFWAAVPATQRLGSEPLSRDSTVYGRQTAQSRFRLPQ